MKVKEQIKVESKARTSRTIDLGSCPREQKDMRQLSIMKFVKSPADGLNPELPGVFEKEAYEGNGLNRPPHPHPRGERVKKDM